MKLCQEHGSKVKLEHALTLFFVFGTNSTHRKSNATPLGLCY